MKKSSALVLIILSLSLAGVSFGQTVESPPAENPVEAAPGGETVEQPTTPAQDPAAAPDPNSPSMITMPGLSDMKSGAHLDPGSQQQASGSTSTLPDYRIGSGDVLRISVWREAEVSVDGVAVRSDGKISLPLIREVYALGLMPIELETVLTREFAKLINNPVVTVIVKEINSQKVYLMGGVVRPGSLLLRTPMTILQVLAEAGGLTDFAKKKKIYIIRKEGGQESRIQFNYEAVLKGDNPEQNIPVRPGDTIVVPE
ncbi:MAG: polysaccharide biosynthesis/export family protein [Bryobacterales bacterium]